MLTLHDVPKSPTNRSIRNFLKIAVCQHMYFDEYLLVNICCYPSSTYYWFCISHFYDWGWVGRLLAHPPPIIKIAPGLIPL